MKALGVLKLRGEEPAWKKLEFIDRTQDLDMNDVPSLVKEINRLRLEKSEIAAQLEKTQTLLQTHLEMEKERETIHQAEMHKVQLQLKAANNRIEELVRIADFRAKNYKEMLMKTGAVFKPYDQEDDEFSVITESDLHAGENTFDVLIKDCEIDELVVKKILAGKVSDMRALQTICAIDFYNHETQSSAVCEGLKPNYNFQIAYRVTVDEPLINYMENESLKVFVTTILA